MSIFKHAKYWENIENGNILLRIVDLDIIRNKFSDDYFLKALERGNFNRFSSVVTQQDRFVFMRQEVRMSEVAHFSYSDGFDYVTFDLSTDLERKSVISSCSFFKNQPNKLEMSFGEFYIVNFDDLVNHYTEEFMVKINPILIY